MARHKRILTATLYCYTEPGNATYAKAQGRQKWGSFSNYVNYLIAKDAGNTASVKRSQELAKAMMEPSLVKERKPTPPKKKVAPKAKAKKATAKKAAKKGKKKAASKPKLKKVETKAPATESVKPGAVTQAQVA